MRFLKYALIIPAIMLIGAELSHSADVIGKVTIYPEGKSGSEIYPLVSGNRMQFSDRSVIKFSGGAVMADKGAVIEAAENNGVMVFKVAKGDISFKVVPDRTQVMFVTPQAELRTPRLVKISTGKISGVLMVSDTTLVKVIQGEMDAVTYNGTKVIKEGEALVFSDRDIAQADVKSSKPEEAAPVGNSSSGAGEGTQMQQPDEILEAMSELPENLLDLLGMIGSRGVAETPLSPDGKVKVAAENRTEKAKIVDYAMIESGEELPAGKDVKVICFSADQETKEEMLLVRPYDSFYPEKPLEKNLIKTTVLAKDNLTPRGTSDFAQHVSGRSNSGWNTVVVDANMQPDYTGSITEGTPLDVVCVQSMLVLQPVDIVNEKYVNLVGKTVTTQTALSPEGRVALANADSGIMQALLVDVNLGPIEGYSVPPNTNLTIVGVKETPAGPVVLVQQPQDVLSEVNYAVGQTITNSYDLSEFGIVNLKNAQWYAQVVGTDFETASATFPAGTVFKVVSVNTSLLVNTPTALVALFAPAPAAATIAGVAGATAVTVGAAGTVALVPVIANDSGNNGASQIQPTQ